MMLLPELEHSFPGRHVIYINLVLLPFCRWLCQPCSKVNIRVTPANSLVRSEYLFFPRIFANLFALGGLRPRPRRLHLGWRAAGLHDEPGRAAQRHWGQRQAGGKRMQPKQKIAARWRKLKHTAVLLFGAAVSRFLDLDIDVTCYWSMLSPWGPTVSWSVLPARWMRWSGRRIKMEMDSSTTMSLCGWWWLPSEKPSGVQWNSVAL